MSLFNGRKRATPGNWYGEYRTDWGYYHAISREIQPGWFAKNDVWVTSTPDHDKQWFERHGMDMPKKVHVPINNEGEQ